MKLATVVSMAALAAVAFGVTASLAAEDPILARQALMKDNGKHAKMGVQMIKGEAPFDLAKAKAIFVTFETAAAKMPGLFPPDSKSGHDTTVSPKIWENMADVKARFEKLGADAKAAEASVKDLAGFKTAFSAIGKDCGGCHKEYRIKKN